MAVVDQIAAIRADDSINDAEKRRRVDALKSSSLVAAAQPFVGKSYTWKGVTYRLIAAQTTFQPLNAALMENVLYVVYTRSDQQGLQERVIVNPPVLTGDRREALLEVVQTLLED